MICLLQAWHKRVVGLPHFSLPQQLSYMVEVGALRVAKAINSLKTLRLGSQLSYQSSR